MNLTAARRALHLGGGTAAGALACAVVAAGGVRTDALERPSLGAIFLLASVLVLTCTAVARRVRFVTPSARAQRVSFWLAAAPALADMEVSFAIAAASYAVLAATGGLDSPAYPLVYGVVAFAVTFQSRAGAAATVGAVVILELACFLRQPFGMESVVPMLLHAAFIGGAVAAHALLLRGMVLLGRHRWQRRLASEVHGQREAARDFRLISAALSADSRAPRSRSDEEHMLAVGGVQTIHDVMFYTLGLIKRCLGARTAILLWLPERGGEHRAGEGADTLKIKEVVTDTEAVIESGVVVAAGALAAVLRDRAPVLHPRARAKQIPYYDANGPDGAFLGVPVLDGGHLRGVVCCDREAPFDDVDVALLLGACEQLLRAIQSEQIFLAVERAKYEHERFYQASAMLCKALTLGQVMETAFDAAAEIVDYDIAVITIYDGARKRHRVASARIARGAEDMVPARQLAGVEFRDNAGLAAMVVKNKHYLPAGGEVRDITAPVYDKRTRIKGAESLLVLPLLSGDLAVGTFTLAARRPRCFGKDIREMLSIIANQVAVSLQNGMMYEKMETMATTDGLTGLTNHRTFQERFEQLLERAERHGQPAAVLLCDVDHFKRVNDTYGHPVGDEVLRQVARVLREAVRKIDIPARYGGEEFAVVLEATDLEGAMQLANRIRTDVGALVIDSDKGKFQVAMSVGVACFPGDAKSRADLIERADHALYHAKETGRNRCVSYREFIAAQRARKAS